MEIRRYYKEARERGNNATSALRIARQHDAKIAEYQTAKTAWKAEPDKRRYAPGGSANRPKFPSMYARDVSDHVPDGYRLFGFLADDGIRSGLSDSPDFGYYADEWQDSTYYPCVLIRRTSEPHVWACIPAYYNADAEFYFFTDRNPRDLARSDELFDTSGYGQGNPERSGYSLCRDARDAAISALHMAESAAEDAREYDERWNSASRHSDERDDARRELKDARQVARAAITALREQRALFGIAPQVYELLRAAIGTAHADMRRAIARIERETAAIAELGMAGDFPA